MRREVMYSRPSRAIPLPEIPAAQQTIPLWSTQRGCLMGMEMGDVSKHPPLSRPRWLEFKERFCCLRVVER